MVGQIVLLGTVILNIGHNCLFYWERHNCRYYCIGHDCCYYWALLSLLLGTIVFIIGHSVVIVGHNCLFYWARCCNYWAQLHPRKQEDLCDVACSCQVSKETLCPRKGSHANPRKHFVLKRAHTPILFVFPSGCLGLLTGGTLYPTTPTLKLQLGPLFQN